MFDSKAFAASADMLKPEKTTDEKADSIGSDRPVPSDQTKGRTKINENNRHEKTTEKTTEEPRPPHRPPKMAKAKRRRLRQKKRLSPGSQQASKDFPEKTDLSTPESAMAAESQNMARMNLTGRS